MRNIRIKEGLTTDFLSEFKKTNSIQIQDKPFAGGGFGDIYNCISVNNDSVSIPQVIKIFKDDEKGGIVHSYNTIKKLQALFSEKINVFKNNGDDFFDDYPAFLGIPQYSFTGEINGNKVVGYSANNLTELNFSAFKEIDENSTLKTKYFRRDITELYTISYHLVRAFSVLKDMKFIHADLKLDNLFISNDEAYCAIIDFDSGSIIENLDDNPYTIGTLQDWLAPEIAQKMNVGISEKEINLFTDLWSVAIAIHYILNVSHPLFYLKQLSFNTLEDYTSRYKWPYISPDEPYFNNDNKEAYESYVEDLQQDIAPELLQLLEISNSDGILTPSRRVTYYQWILALGQIIPKENRKKSVSQFIAKSQKKTSKISTSTNTSINRTSYPSSNKSDFIEYMSALIYDIIVDDENITMHKNFIKRKAKNAGLNPEKHMIEVDDFFTLYSECIEDKKISNLERMSLIHQAKLSYISEKTVNKLLKKYK